MIGPILVFLLLLVATCHVSISAFAFSSPSSYRFSSISPLHRQPAARFGSSRLYFKSPSSLQQLMLEQCVLQRNVDAKEMIDVLEQLEETPLLPQTLSQEDLQGTFEFVFSSSIANLPFVGNYFNGYYYPKREIIHFDFDQGQMGIDVKFFPIPKFPIVTIPAEDLKLDPERKELRYTIKGKSEESVWTLLYVDEDILAAKCSMHIGLIVLRRIRDDENTA